MDSSFACECWFYWRRTRVLVMALLCGAAAQVTFQKVSWGIQDAGLGPAQGICKPKGE